MKYPNIEANAIIIKTINSVLRKLRSISFLFLSINAFIIAEVNAIKKYPTIRANVPIYFGKKMMHKIKRAEETI